MQKLWLLPMVVTVLFAVEDPWSKVDELKSGTELRIIRHGSTKPVLATLEEVHDDGLVVATKKEEIAIPKQDIDRIDFRPERTKGRVTKETKSTENPPDFSGPDDQRRAGRPTESSSTSLTFGSGKPDFETIYRRTASMPANK